eukprot:GSChrysophyteH1.ASY1.ANO1.987.1 assembled CDS
MFLSFIIVASLLALVYSEDAAKFTASSPFWPQPTSFSLGNGVVTLSSSFHFKQVQKVESDLLNRGMKRYQKIYEKYENSVSQSKGEILDSCNINVETVENDVKKEKATLNLDVDESYTIDITEDGKCDISSSTVWGALHALESFTQLLSRPEEGASSIQMTYAPVSLSNEARFAHRGVLLDSARHYLPMDTLKKMIDSLPMANFNVMHWHVEDAQSFPLDTPSSPKMVKGAFKPSETYSMEQVQELDQYATDRGVRIVYEVDGPGHTASWGKGYPELINEACAKKYFYDINDLAFLHLGGDEVVYGCWALDDQITQYMEENNIASYPELLGVYVDKAEAIATSLDTTPIQWEDTFIAGIRPPTNAIFDVWTNSTQISAVTAAGYRVIAAPQDYWYLDHADNTWQKMYAYDPTEGGDLNDEQKKLIIGGETSMWGEKVDQYNIESKVWPTAAAVGERLWSSRENTSNKDMGDATIRLKMFICRMNERGFYAGPISPSYCSVNFV